MKSLLIAFAFSVAVVGTALAASQTITLQPGDVASVSCSTSIGGSIATQTAQVWCNTPVPTATPEPTSTPAAVATFTPSPTPAEPVPFCTDLTPTVWHSLAEYDSAGNVICATGFTSGDNPDGVDDIFGTPGAWFGSPGQSIGYPWADAAESQGSNFHYYKWEVRRDLQPSYPAPTTDTNYFQSFRIENHIHASAGPSIQKQIHSYSWEAVICDPSGNCGMVRMGGTQDYGSLMVNDATAGDVCYQMNANNVPPSCNGSPRRIIAGLNSNRRTVTWYGSNTDNHQAPWPTVNITANVGVIEQGWGPLDTSNPLNVLFWDPNTFNASTVSAEVMEFDAPSQLAVNGRINASGYTDDWGNVLPAGACQVAGPNCVPFSLVNIPSGKAQYRDSIYNAQYGTTLGDASEDVHVDGQSLIRYPN